MAAQLIAMVRHARAGDREAWAADDDLRPLSQRGCEQAERLGAHLRLRPDVILASPSLRCLATVLPLARSSGAPLATAPELYEGGDAATALARLVASGGTTVVGCTHGDILLDLLRSLHSAGVDIGEPRLEKGSTWLLDVVDGVVRGARHLPPPA